MDRRARTGTLTAIAALFSLALLPMDGAAQAVERYKVLEPDFQSEDGSDRRFGERTAERLIRHLESYDRHEPVSQREYRSTLDRLRLKREEIGCIQARQLAPQLGANLVMCGTYARGGEGYDVDVVVWTVPSQESYEIEGISVPERNGHEPAAEAVNDRFSVFVRQDALTSFCRTYYESQQFDSALQNCNQALEMAPNARAALLLRGLILTEREDHAGAVRDFERVLENDPHNQTALRAASVAAAAMGDADRATGYFRTFLELDPENVNARLQFAYALLSQADDAAGAVTVIQEGLQRAPDNRDLLESLGGFAYNAAVAEEAAAGDNGELSQKAREFYTVAAEAYEKVVEADPAGVDPGAISGAVNAFVKIGDAARGIALGRKVLDAHPENAALWQVFASAQQQAGNLDEAIAAIEQVKRIEPDRPNMSILQAQWLLAENRFDDAVAPLQEAIRKGEQTEETVAQLVWAAGYNAGYRDNVDLDLGIRAMEAGKRIAFQDATYSAQFDFWHGYGLFFKGMAVGEAQNVNTARASLPLFQDALRLLQAGQSYATSPGSQVAGQYQQLVAATRQQIELQQAIIQRGR